MGGRPSKVDRDRATEYVSKRQAVTMGMIGEGGGGGADGSTTLTTLSPSMNQRARECLDRMGRPFVKDELMVILFSIDPSVPPSVMTRMTCEALRRSIRTAIVEKNLLAVQEEAKGEEKSVALVRK